MVERGPIIEQVDIIEFPWSPVDVATWGTGLVPVRRISREELEEKYGSKHDRDF